MLYEVITNDKFGFIDNWLVHVKDVYRLHKMDLDVIEDEKERANKFVELNVMEQVNNLSMVSFIQEEWEKGEYPYIHGWVYSLNDGLIKDLNVTVNDYHHLDEVYQYNVITSYSIHYTKLYDLLQTWTV